MAGLIGNKGRIVLIAQMLEQLTDENHRITVADMIKILKNNGLTAERKAIYDDIDMLKELGYDIVSERSGRQTGYYLASREFDVAELRMMVDIVQSAKFITPKKSDVLIKKLGTLCSKYEREGLVKRLYLDKRAKTKNEKIFINVDKLHEAINSDKVITYKYVEYFKNGKPVYKRNELYTVSPYYLIWAEENYYLVAYDHRDRKIKHYRVDKMAEISITKEARIGEEAYAELDIQKYTDNMFGMFGGNELPVTLEIENSLVKVFIDRFGSDIILTRKDENTMELRLKLRESDQFYGWLTGLGEGVKIAAPKELADRYTDHLNKILGRY